MLSAAELAAQIRQTAAFIEADPVDLSVSRQTVSRVPGGGVRVSGSPTTTTRRARLIPVGDTTEIGSPNGSSAERREWVLMGLPGLDIREGDTFTYLGQSSVVASVTGGQYEIKARVVARA
jgi:hypothetical protein